MKEMVIDSKLSFTEKKAFQEILLNRENDESINKLFKIDEDLIKLFDEKNKNEYNKFRNSIKEKNEKYAFNSNYIYKL
jgi:predicted phage-related endonuclease